MIHNESEVREIVRILAASGMVPGGLTARRLVLLDGLGELISAEGWAFLLADGELIHRGSEPSPSASLMAWNAPGFRWRAHRATSSPFGPGDHRAVSLIFRHCRWLDGSEPMVEADHPSHGVKSTRIAQVLQGLIQGESRKAIASQLGISINTVAGYAREIYRLHEVKSQTMLIDLFVAGRNHARNHE